MKAYLLIMCILIPMQTFAALTGKIIKLQGEVKNAKGEILQTGSELNQGDIVKTGAKSFVRIKLNYGVVMQAGPSAELKVLSTKSNEPNTIQLLKGGLLSVIRSNKGAERYRVKTAYAVMGVRGTTFYVEEETQKPTFLCVCEGGVAIKNKNKEKLVKTTDHTPMSVSNNEVIERVAVPDGHSKELDLALELKKDLENSTL